MAGSGPYLAVLLIGLAVVLADGQLILRNGVACLDWGERDPRKARRRVRVAALFFHLVMFGTVALVASASFGANPSLSSVVSRIGLLLLLTGLGHGVVLIGLGQRDPDRRVGFPAPDRLAGGMPRRPAGGVPSRPAEAAPPPPPRPAEPPTGPAEEPERGSSTAPADAPEV